MHSLRSLQVTGALQRVLLVASLLVLGCTTPSSPPTADEQIDAGMPAPTALCGDGLREQQEVCDDGNTIDGDGCRGDCAKREVCGDGELDVGEVCDDENLVSGDGCRADCAGQELCGDNVVDVGETCDDGNTIDGDGCDGNCVPTGCGNGVTTAGESCDDGNQENGDGCRSDCLGEELCGDGLFDVGEACDDGNSVDGDGCDSNCVATGCGNGLVTGNESCDDGNTTSGDGCDNNCTPTACGNGVTTIKEVCDDGNTSSGDGCRGDCQGSEVCGDTFLDLGEACDDGNTSSGDGCRGDCQGSEVCGDTFLDLGEACDDGNTSSGDGCRGDCQGSEVCGDTFLDLGEACDDGNTSSGDGCRGDCLKIEACGDDVIDAGEVCDDGNLLSGDGCRSDCSGTEFCGDGLSDITEVCDDGNTSSGDGCRGDCLKLEACGDDVIDEGEVCDDGNAIGGDGCSNDCLGVEACGNGVVDEGELCLLAAPAYPVGGWPIAMEVADLNGDSLPDVVTANSESFDDITVLLGDSYDAFDTRTDHVVGQAPNDVIVSDIDDDGVLDVIVIAQDDNDVVVLFGDGFGSFTLGPKTKLGLGLDPIWTNLSAVASGFVDGDSNLDLVVMYSGPLHGVYVLLGNGDGTFLTMPKIPLESRVFDLQLVDLNADNELDIVLGAGTIIIALGNGDGTFATANSYPAPDSGWGIRVGDVDGDNVLDLVTGGKVLSVLLGFGDGSFGQAQSTSLLTFFDWRLTDLVDVDGDGALDAVLVTEQNNLYLSSLNVRYGRGDSTFNDSVEFPVGFMPSDARVADFNGDQIADIAVLNKFGSHLRVLLGRGQRQFVTHHSILAMGNSYGIDMGDFDLDGDQDLASTGGFRDAIVTLGNGDGYFGDISSYPTDASGGPIRIQAVDVNDDGIDDLITANGDWSTVPDDSMSVLFGVGDGTFGAPLVLDLGTGLIPRDVGAADLDGDGNVDIIVATTQPDTITVLHGTGAGVFAAPLQFANPGGAIAMDVADATGDGIPDAIVCNIFQGLISGEGNLALLTGDGSGGFLPAITLVPDYRVDAVVVSDFDADGIPDIAAAYMNFDLVLILMGEGGGVFADPVAVPVFDIFSSPIGLVAADLNGDGNVDLATANHDRATITALLGVGDGTFPSQASFALSHKPSALTVGDVDGDGLADIVVRHTFRVISVLLGREP